MSSQPSPARRGSGSAASLPKPPPGGPPSATEGAAPGPAAETTLPAVAALETEGVPPDPAALARAEGDIPRVIVARIEGGDPADLAGDPATQHPIVVGLEIICQAFEDGEVRAGRIVEVYLEEEGAILWLEELGWLWPIQIDRINVPAGEWVHIPTDYPAPGADEAWDRSHRMSPERREELEALARAEAERSAARPGEGATPRRSISDLLRARDDRLARETEAQTTPPPELVVPVAVPRQMHAAPPARPEGILATWHGPGNLGGPWIRHGETRVGDFAPPGAKGYFPASAVHSPRLKGQFTIH